MRVVWSQRALDRTVEIATYIAQDSPAASREWVERLFSHVDTQLSAFPLSGKPARDVDADARELVFESYRVFYDVGDSVQILTVRRGGELIDAGELRSGPGPTGASA
jgi:plasmid stabilization system protein ParE